MPFLQDQSLLFAHGYTLSTVLVRGVYPSEVKNNFFLSRESGMPARLNLLDARLRARRRGLERLLSGVVAGGAVLVGQGFENSIGGESVFRRERELGLEAEEDFIGHSVSDGGVEIEAAI